MEYSTLPYCPGRLFDFFALLARMVLRPSGSGQIEQGGQIHRFPLPRFSAPRRVAEERVVYLALGAPDLGTLFRGRAADFGWTYVDQMGAAYQLENQGWRLTAIVEKCRGPFTALEFVCTPKSGASAR